MAGFTLGTATADAAVLAYRGIAFAVGKLRAWYRLGSMAGREAAGEAMAAADGGEDFYALAGVPIKGRTIVVGEHQPSVMRFATEHGYDTMPRLPATMSRAEKLAANRAWIRARMDEGYWIVDLGPSPLKANYPYITSPYYAMERAEIATRGYSRWLPVWGM